MAITGITVFKTKVLEAVDEGGGVHRLRLDSHPAFKPGQFFMVGMGEKGFKAMSACSSPLRPHIEFAAKISSSEYKQKWARVKPGDEVEIKGPYGVFILDESTPKVAMLAGGIGVTPFKSYLEYAADKGLQTEFTLVYSNKTEQERPFSKLFEQMQTQGKIKLKFVETLTRLPDVCAWKGCRGRICAELIEKQVPDFRERIFYTCGVPLMVKEMCTKLEQMGIEKQKIKREEFTGMA